MWPWSAPPTNAGGSSPADGDDRGRPRGVLAWLRGRLGGWPGAALAREHGADADLRAERVRSGPPGVVLPWFLPYFDPDQTLHETQAMRLAYRKMLADPNVKAAVLGKVLAVGALDLRVIPAGKDPRDLALAEFVRYNLEECLAGGVPGMAWSILSGALLDGYSVCEKVWSFEAKGDHAGKYVLRALKPKDTGRDVVLETDEFRNVVGVKGLRYNPGVTFHPSHFVLYRHLPLFDAATGMSDLRAVYLRWWMLDTVLKLRAVGLEKRSLPMLLGVYQTPQQRPSLEAALALAKSQNWFAVPEGVRVEALNIAGSADATFAEAVKDLKHDIFLGIQGAILQALEGSVADGRGNSQVHRTTADLLVWYLAQSLEQLLNDREFGLVRDIVDLNFAAGRYPKARLSAVDIDEQLREAELDTKLSAVGLELSKEDLYERYNRKPPASPDDSVAGRQAQQAAVREAAKEPGLQGDLPGPPPAPGEGDVSPPKQFGEGPHRYASTQFNLSPADARRVLALVAELRKRLAAAGARFVEDDYGHEHGADGKFVSKGGGSSAKAGGKEAHARAKAEHAARGEARQKKRNALAARREALETLSVGHDDAGRLASLRRAAENPADPAGSAQATLTLADETPSVFAAESGAAVKTLEGAGVPERHLGRAKSAAERGHAAVGRAANRLAKAAGKEAEAAKAHAEAKAAYDEVERQEPQPAPSEADALQAREPGIADDDPRLLEAEANDQKADAEYEKALARWEKARDRAEEKLSKAEERLESAQGDSAAALDDLDEAHAQATAAVEDAVEAAVAAGLKALDGEESALDDEEEADPEPEEPEDDDDGGDEPSRFDDAGWDEAKHPRREDGKFGRDGGGGAAAPPEPDPDKNRPSRPENRHKAEDGSRKLPPAKPWQAPPPKQGRKGEGMPARPKGDASQTKIGDMGESLATRLGFRSILPEGQRSNKAGENEEKGSTIDLEFDHSGRAYELKLCNTTATEYRLKAKAKEKEQKQKFADLHDLTPHVLVGVRDVETGEVHFYAGREPGFLGAEVSEKHYDYIGSVKP